MRTMLGNIGELTRFMATGGVATLCNMAVVWICRDSLPVNVSFVCGLLMGLCVSFVMMKLFAFKATEWTGARGEFVRFLIVYAFGTCVYLAAAMLTESLLSDVAVPARFAAITGVFVGGAFMAVTSYFGHRNFTYATSRFGNPDKG